MQDANHALYPDSTRLTSLLSLSTLQGSPKTGPVLAEIGICFQGVSHHPLAVKGEIYSYFLVIRTCFGLAQWKGDCMIAVFIKNTRAYVPV